MFCSPANNIKRPRRLGSIANICLRRFACRPACLISRPPMNQPVSTIVVLPLEAYPQPVFRKHRFGLFTQDLQFSLADMMLLVTAVTGGIGILTAFPASTAAVLYPAGQWRVEFRSGSQVWRCLAANSNECAVDHFRTNGSSHHRIVARFH